MSDETEKYPISIQKLFAPKPPLLYKPSVDYAPETRKTIPITPISKFKSNIKSYLEEINQVEPSQRDARFDQLQRKKEASRKRKETFERQLDEWLDPESLRNNDYYSKDPYKTVFIARLDYSLSELDLSKNFTHFGSIDSIKLVRDKETGQSKGYAFIVFERESDAANCVKELSYSGLKMGNRTSLVDIERGRVIRFWKPRRLAGGLGGRHYTTPKSLLLVTASAAASGRRTNLPLNPYNSSPSFDLGMKRPAPSRPNVDPKRPKYRPSPTTPGADSIKDKYAKYSNAPSANNPSMSSSSNRSIRSIRLRD